MNVLLLRSCVRVSLCICVCSVNVRAGIRMRDCNEGRPNPGSNHADAKRHAPESFFSFFSCSFVVLFSKQDSTGDGQKFR